MASKPRRFTYLERKRLAARHTLSSLAPLLRCSVSHLSCIEAGKRRPGPELFFRLAEALGVDHEELIARAPKPPMRKAGLGAEQSGRAA